MKARVNDMATNVIKLTKFQLNNRKSYILGWAIGVFAMMFLYMILFESMKDLGQAKFDAMPKEILEFMGVESMAVMTNWISYYGMIFSLFTLVVSFFGATFAGSLLYNEEKTKSIEFLNALPVSRLEIFFSKILTSFVAVVIVSLAMDSSALICGLLNGGPTFVATDALTIMKITGFVPFFFTAIALFVGGLTARVATGLVASGAVITFYMLGYLGSLLENDIMTNVSPFKVFEAANALNLSGDVFLLFGVFLVTMFTIVFLGGFVYNKRDFNI